jgi:hypothetical protein
LTLLILAVLLVPRATRLGQKKEAFVEFCNNDFSNKALLTELSAPTTTDFLGKSFNSKNPLDVIECSFIPSPFRYIGLPPTAINICFALIYDGLSLVSVGDCLLESEWINNHYSLLYPPVKLWSFRLFY